MKFVDEVRIQVKAGDGGSGAVAFRREKYIEHGGPSGGDGGNGGSVIFYTDPGRTTLLDYRFQPIHRAASGEPGRGGDCNGRGAADLELPVPVGTVVKNADTGEVLFDLSDPGARAVVARGGRGGLGNMNFATPARQAPRFAQPGTAGEERSLLLELKLLADVGLLGFPNVGKSSLVSRVSRAKPKVADYPFTTLVPHLGVVQYKDGLSFVIADIPGLIEGASDGKGLGHTFLRHVERCRVLIHLLDLSAVETGRTPLDDLDTLNRELARYSPKLAKTPQVIAANKIDLPVAREACRSLERSLSRRNKKLYPISAATGEGVGALLDAVAQVLFRPAAAISETVVRAAPTRARRTSPIGRRGTAKQQAPSTSRRGASEQQAPSTGRGGPHGQAPRSTGRSAAKQQARSRKTPSRKQGKKAARR